MFSEKKLSFYRKCSIINACFNVCPSTILPSLRMSTFASKKVFPSSPVRPGLARASSSIPCPCCSVTALRASSSVLGKRRRPSKASSWTATPHYRVCFPSWACFCINYRLMSIGNTHPVSLLHLLALLVLVANVMGLSLHKCTRIHFIMQNPCNCGLRPKPTCIACISVEIDVL